MSKLKAIFGGDDSAQEAAERARAAEEARQARIREGFSRVDDTFGAFNDDYYAGMRQDYLDWALPQLTRQQQKQNRNIVLALSPRGTLNSGTRARLQAELEGAGMEQERMLMDRAEDIVNKRRQAVETARGNLYNTVRASADPAAAAQHAANQAQILTPAPAYQPLGQLFQDFSATVADIKRHQPERSLVPGVQIYRGGGGGSSAVVS